MKAGGPQKPTRTMARGCTAHVAPNFQFGTWISDLPPTPGYSWTHRNRDSNAHSFQFASNLCPKNEYKVCVLNDCDYYPAFSEESQLPKCDRWGCSYNPYQMGATDFYGKGKKVDTSKMFTWVRLRYTLSQTNRNEANIQYTCQVW